MNGLKNFCLAGHSFGGYVVGNYSVKYHMHLKKVMLISPVGIWPAPKDADPYAEFVRKTKEIEQKHGIKPPSVVTTMALKALWSQKMSPFGFARIMGQKNLR